MEQLLRTQVFAPWTMDDEYARIAREEIPGFAGIRKDPDGELVFLLADTSGASSKMEKWRNMQIARGVNSLTARLPMRVQHVPRDFAALKDLSDHVHERVLPKVKWTMLDIDEANNKVVLGIPDWSLAGDARRALKVLGKEGDDVEVQVIPPMEPVQPTSCVVGAPTCYPMDSVDTPGEYGGPGCGVGLQCYQRPLVGGLEITWTGGGNEYRCTLGAIVQIGTEIGFLTASHCSNYLSFQRSGDNTVYSQGGTAIGYKRFDPMFTYTAGCVPGYVCRISDAQFVSFQGYNPWYAMGYGARPVYSDVSGSQALEISDLQGFRIYQERRPPLINLPVGTQIMKVGRSTGRTTAIVDQACANYSAPPAWNGDQIELKCFWRAHSAFGNAVIGAGDSGGPVYSESGPDVMLEGIVSAKPATSSTIFVFSTFFSAAGELGAMVCGSAACVGARAP